VALADLEDTLDFNREVEGQRGDAHRKTCVTAGFTEDADQKL
jgi:hypothetical protein